MSTAALSYSGPLTEAKSSTKAAEPKIAAPKTAAPKTAALKTAALKTAALKTAAPASSKGLLARFYDAMIEARMRQAMRELAMHRHLMPENSVTIER